MKLGKRNLISSLKETGPALRFATPLNSVNLILANAGSLSGPGKRAPKGIKHTTGLLFASLISIGHLRSPKFRNFLFLYFSLFYGFVQPSAPPSEPICTPYEEEIQVKDLWVPCELYIQELIKERMTK